MHKILLVDDSRTIHMMLRKVLVEGGYEVLDAADGHEAIRILETNPVELIVTDIYMPEGDGIELLTAIRRMKKQPPIVAMSSKTGGMDMLHTAKLLGAKFTLYKPFPPNELLRCVASLLETEPAQV